MKYLMIGYSIIMMMMIIVILIIMTVLEYVMAMHMLASGMQIQMVMV